MYLWQTDLLLFSITETMVRLGKAHAFLCILVTVLLFYVQLGLSDAVGLCAINSTIWSMFLKRSHYYTFNYAGPKFRLGVALASPAMIAVPGDVPLLLRLSPISRWLLLSASTADLWPPLNQRVVHF